MKSRLLVLFAGLIALLPVIAGASGQNHQSIASMKSAIEDFVTNETGSRGREVQVEVGYIDPRLQLRRCAAPPEAFLPPGSRLSGKSTIGLRCKGPKPWKVYIPVTISEPTGVLVATRPLPRGHRVGPEDVRFAEKDTSSLTSGYLTEMDAAVGMVMKYNVRAGAVLKPSVLAAPKLVRRGEKVDIIAEYGGIVVRMKGKSLDDGSRGQVIRVRNLSSGKVIEGEVVAAGTVRVSGGQ